jgi:4a-hydroxytetrahydrobiopterin dehydratase
MALLSADEVHERLEGVEGWERSGNSIRKHLEFDDFAASVRFVDRLVEPAEDLGHHPDVEISGSKVVLKASTHSEGGLTDTDFELAKRLDALD